MRYFLIILGLLFCNLAPAKKITIGVIDTGFGYNMQSLMETHLCKYGHRDLTSDQQFANFNTKAKVPLDLMGHGTNIVGLIEKYANKEDTYCFVVIKWYSGKVGVEEKDNALEGAIQYAVNLKVDIMNISAGGSGYRPKEYKAIVEYLDSGGLVSAAAGNDGANLDIPGNNYYPAMYDKRIMVVGNIYLNGSRVESSNYGMVVKYWETGYRANAFGLTLTGTSQSCAIHTGKVVNKLRK